MCLGRGCNLSVRVYPRPPWYTLPPWYWTLFRMSLRLKGLFWAFCFGPYSLLINLFVKDKTYNIHSTWVIAGYANVSKICINHCAGLTLLGRISQGTTLNTIATMPYQNTQNKSETLYMRLKTKSRYFEICSIRGINQLIKSWTNLIAAKCAWDTGVSKVGEIMMILLLAFHPEFYKLQMILSDETVGTNAVTSLLVHPFF